MTRAILTMLRAEGAMDAKVITLRLMAERQLNLTDRVLAKAMQKRIGAALRNLRDRQLATSNQGAGGMLLWHVGRI